MNNNSQQLKVKGKQGFASMDPEKQRAIAGRGGKASHAAGTAHRFTREEARLAGRKGGVARRQRGSMLLVIVLSCMAFSLIVGIAASHRSELITDTCQQQARFDTCMRIDGVDPEFCEDAARVFSQRPRFLVEESCRG
jgi:general stress protein YciG